MKKDEKKTEAEKMTDIEIDQMQVQNFWRKFSKDLRPAIEQDDADRAFAKAIEPMKTVL